MTTAQLLSGWLRQVSGMYVKDLNALPAEAYTASFAGVARTPHDFTAEVAGFNMMLAGLVAGEMTQPSDEERAAYTASLDTPEKGGAAVMETAAMLADAVLANEAKLDEMTTAPWGAEMTIGEFVNICANHIMYHDGQLTYIQSLHGDKEMHWFDA